MDNIASVRQQLFQSDNHVALLPAYMVSCMLFRVHSRGFTEVVLLVVGRHGFFANLNLSGEVKGRALGMRLKYPQAANYRALLTLRIIPNFLV